MPPESRNNPVPRMEKKMPLRKHIANHFSLVLKLTVEASSTQCGQALLLIVLATQGPAAASMACQVACDRARPLSP